MTNIIVRQVCKTYIKIREENCEKQLETGDLVHPRLKGLLNSDEEQVRDLGMGEIKEDGKVDADDLNRRLEGQYNRKQRNGSNSKEDLLKKNWK